MHSKEPWSIGVKDHLIKNSEGHVICTTDGLTNDKKEDACVNACAGEPTGALELFPYSEQVGLKVKFFNENNQLREQRDELIAALKPLVERLRDYEDIGPYGESYQSTDLDNEIAAADAAIAKCEVQP